MTIEQRYTIIADAHFRAIQRVKAKQIAKQAVQAKLRSQIKPFEPVQKKASA